MAGLLPVTVASIGVLVGGEARTWGADVTVDASRTIGRLAPESIGLSTR